MTSTWTENIIERYCVLTEDAGAGKPVQLMDWQRGLIRDAEGKRMVWLEIPRKNGKSAFIAMLAIAHLLKGFKDGTNPQVILAAATREQAGILFGYVRNMILLNPQLQKVLEPFRKEIRLKGKPGYLKTITSDGGSNHGLNPSLILCDEIHSWNEVKGPELWEALRTSMAARPSQMIAITTAGSAYSFAHKWHEYAQRVAEQPEIDPSWLTIIYGAGDDEDPHSPEVWQKANPSLGVTVTYQYLEELSNTAKHDEPTLLSLRKLHLNQWAGSAQPYIELGKWLKCQGGRPKTLDKWRCFLGVDLAAVNDFTAYAVVYFNGERFYTQQYYQITDHAMSKRKQKYPNLVRNWIKNGSLDVVKGEVTTTDHRIAMIEQIMNDHPVEGIFFDPWNAAETVERLRSKYGKQFCWEVRQSALMVNEPMKLLYRMVTTKGITHDGNPITAWMIANTSLHIDKNDNWTFQKDKAPDRIDGTAALITALAGYVHNASTGISTYEDIDLIFV
jgi:phage terminase large subunit-like protein